MPTDLNPLSFEEHRDMAQEMLTTRSKLLELSNVAVSIYGPQSRPGFSFQVMIDALDRVCAEMRAQAELDCPGLGAGAFYTGAKT